jgi:hypothetical protein
VRGSCCEVGDDAAAGTVGVDEPLVEAGAVVAAGALVVAGAVAAGVVEACCFAGFFGALGAVSGSWYCWSPAPSAKAAVGVAASSSAAMVEVRVRRDIAVIGSRRFA